MTEGLCLMSTFSLTSKVIIEKQVNGYVPSYYLSPLSSFPSLPPLPPPPPPLSFPSPLPLSAAQPTPEEAAVHAKVAMVLSRAPEVIADLRGYQGAGEHIRELRTL